MNNKDAVSVFVITYNSAKTVIETLDSIFKLTYPSIELIVSDDASTDDTVSICADWIESHKTRFQRTEIITVAKNTGVAANAKRAHDACRTTWAKGIAGDDALYPESIEHLMKFVSNHPDAKLVFGRSGRYDTFLDEDHFIEYHGSKNDAINRVSTAKQQFDIMLCWACIDAPTTFFHTSVFHNPELQNCGYMGLEDYPLFLKFCKLGNRIYFCDELICKYRQSSTSLQITSNYGNRITKSYLSHFFQETHNYFYGFEKVARYGVNIFDWLQCYTKNKIIRKTLYIVLYPTYWAFFKIKTHYDYKRINNALAQELCNE